ncbi:hypothetical protein OPT61_g8043 [Boeremia exigua]|uniref:Uncharacterized protein n=1 Tax=Boeremia exigua TaxID=749465 RepID=A0ACC2I076_9PLEO|nr:hypothetical protein OPT61_g8043 [Boeremia exigua]
MLAVSPDQRREQGLTAACGRPNPPGVIARGTKSIAQSKRALSRAGFCPVCFSLLAPAHRFSSSLPPSTKTTIAEMGKIVRLLRWSRAFLALVGIGLGVPSRNESSPLQAIHGVSTHWILICVIWLALALFYSKLLWHNAMNIANYRIWAMVTLGLVGLSTYYFSVVGFKAYDWYFWGPAAAELGEVVTNGFMLIQASIERGSLRNVVDFIWGRGGGGDGEDNNNNNNNNNNEVANEEDDQGIPLDVLPPPATANQPQPSASLGTRLLATFRAYF